MVTRPMTAKEAAEQCNVSVALIYGAMKSGKLRAVRFGIRGKGTWRVLPEDLELWVQSLRWSEIPPPPQPRPSPRPVSKHLRL